MVYGKLARMLSGELDAPMPVGLLPCQFCGGQCMDTVGLEDGFDSRGWLVRVYYGCDEADAAMDPEDMRTGFGFDLVAEVVEEWNRAQLAKDYPKRPLGDMP